MDSEQTSTRRIYNIGVHGQSKLLDFDLNASGGARRYDQIFDSQLSHYSHDQSQEFSSSRVYDSNLIQTHQIKKSETEVIKTTHQVQFSTQKRNYLDHMKSSTGLERIDENKRGLKNQALKHKSSQQSLGYKEKNAARNNDLSDIVSQSHKLEESVKAPDRLPVRVPGLTDFLCDQHYKRIGVFTKSQKELFKFWKNYVSLVYRLRKQNQSKLDKTVTDMLEANLPLCQSIMSNANPALGVSFKSHAQKENISEENKDKVSQLYQKYEKLYEMDVVYTLQKDIEEEEDEFKKQRLRREIEEKEKYEAYLRDQDQRVMRMMLEEYYQDLRDFKIRIFEEKDQKLKDEKEKNQNKNWHKLQSKDSLNPIESLDDEKKEPKKPTISKEEQDKEKNAIEKQIDNEFNFMLNLFFAARDENSLTNDPNLLMQFYKQQKEKARQGLTWGKGDDDVSKIIKEFFIPERFLKRLTIYFALKNRLGQYKQISLFGFYKQIKPKDRLLNFIDWKPINKPKNIKDVSREERKTTQGEDANYELKFEDRIYSVEEIINEYENFQKLQLEEQRLKQKREHEEKLKKHQKRIKEQVFGKEKILKMEKELNSKNRDEKLRELAKPKDKWKRGKILMELRKKFPHDIVLQKMIKEEFKQNRVFKYPEEYDQYDDEQEYLCKYWHWDQKGLETKDLEAGKKLKEQFKVLDDQELYYLKRKVNEQRRQEKDFEQFIIGKVHDYLEMKKKRLQGQKETLREFVSNLYHLAKEQFPQFVDEKFPHLNYGVKKNSEAFKKSYPQSFKKYFFQLVKSFVKNKKGHIKRFKNVPPTFVMPGGKRCTIHDFGCPEDCQYATLNKRVILKSTMIKRKQKDPKTFRSRVWRRRDFKNALQSVYMLGSELQNCTFEPETGSMSKNLETTLNVNFNLRNNGYDNEPDPEVYFNKLGKNFETSHPEVYKAGVLKRAKLKYMQGKYEEAMNTLYEGFNIDSIKRKFDPKQQKRHEAEMKKKAQREQEQREKEEEDKKQVSFMGRRIQKDAPESQKKKPEEDFDNKKLISVLTEAFDLVQIIENRKKDAEKQIRTIKRSQTTIKKQMRSFSSFKKSQTRIDISRGEKILFKSIMCPLKDQCSMVKKPRWPTSNTKSVTQFGQECPYAHHPMELRFPESIVTKLSSSFQTIKNINNRMDSEKSHHVFKPAGALFDCKGCQKCNLCRYQELAIKENIKYSNKQLKDSLTRSMERRESVEFREDRKEMNQIMEALDLDNNYTKKFGLLKKACVLYFYGRYNDAFDEIAKAVKIIQDQKEIEQQKQRIVEKRWRFKLGLDDGFELPIPIEQIDINKVDEKFLIKMELNGQVALSTLKLFIEQVHPNKNEEYSKHAFLNKMIEDYYLQFESAIEDKQNTIKKMKKQVEKLDEEADFMEAFGASGLSPPERSPEKGEDGHGTIKIKQKKTKMCPVLAEKKFCPLSKVPKCPHAHSEYELERMAPGSKMCEKVLKMEKCQLVKEKKCPYAHNPIELDLIPTETKMKNLNGVIQSQTSKLKNLKPLEPWRPAKAGDIEHTHLMDMTSKKRKKHGQEDDDDDEENEKKRGTKKRSIFERENVFRKPYDTQD